MKKESTFLHFVKFMAVGIFATVANYAALVLFEFIVFRNLSDIEFHWFLFDYTEENLGLNGFLSTLLSFAISQVVNFICQRKITFKSSSNIVRSAVLFAIMVSLTYIYFLWLPTSFVGLWASSALGAKNGLIVTNIIASFTSALVQYPINKFLIMR